MDLSGRDMHLIKKALAIGVAAIEQQPEEFGVIRALSDQRDMKDLLDRIVDDGEMETYTRSAIIVMTGKVPGRQG